MSAMLQESIGDRFAGDTSPYPGQQEERQPSGADTLIRAFLAGGVHTCFANPGTTEIHLVAALDQTAEMRSVLGLAEGVVTGAADGYARMAEKPAWTLVHLGPGLANGLANLHNARRANVPVINVVGQHATHHLGHDTPLTSDIESIAGSVSGWLRTSRTASTLGFDAVDAISASRAGRGQIATLIVPADAAWGRGGSIPEVPPPASAPMPASAAVDRAAEMLRAKMPSAILLSGNALYGKGLRAAGQIARVTGAKLLAPYPFTRLERGTGAPRVERVHYIREQAKEQLSAFKQFILVGAPTPVAYFAAPAKESRLLAPECIVFELACSGEDCAGAMLALADVLSAGQADATGEDGDRPLAPSGDITLAGIASAIAALLPEDAIVVDESMTSGRGIMPATSAAPPHDWLANTGGSIGIAMPLAVGAAVACPRRPVLCLSADGSGMYTLQALWTMAREGLNVTTLVFANRAYAVLKREFSYLDIGRPGARANDMFEIGRPDLDWVHLAKGMGVPAARATSLDTLAKALRTGFEGGGPSLIEVPV